MVPSKCYHVLRLLFTVSIGIHWLQSSSSSSSVSSFSIVPQIITRHQRRSSSTSQTYYYLNKNDDDTSFRDMARRVQPSVVLVLPKGVRNMTARGSGFLYDIIISEDDAKNNMDQNNNYSYIITAAHVTPPGYDIQLSILEESPSSIVSPTYQPATVVARNITLDLALLQTAKIDDKVQPLKLAEALPQVGSLAFAHGYPASRLRGPAMTMGIVCGIADGLGVPDDNARLSSAPSAEEEQKKNDFFGNDRTTTFVVTDAAMSGGMSGGPLVNVQGQVIGVNALIRPDLRALGNYAVSAQEVRSFLEDHLPNIMLSSSSSSSTGNVTMTTTTKNNSNQQNGTVQYRVWLYNDRMNKKERVSAILTNIANLTDTVANQVMMDAHTKGRGMVANFNSTTADGGVGDNDDDAIISAFQQAQNLCQALKEQDLLVEVDREMQEVSTEI